MSLPGSVARRGLAAVVSAALISGIAGPVAAARVQDLLPNLRMAPLQDIHIQVLANGHRRLRVGTIALNQGQGAFQVRGRRASTSQPLMSVEQRIFLSSGGSRFRTTSAAMKYQGDGHNHWHLQGFVSLELWRVGDPTPSVYNLHKLGFCLIDEVPWSIHAPYATTRRHFFGSIGCGKPWSLSLQPGISPGWGDNYPADFVLQWIDLPDTLRSGEYMLCGTVDRAGDFLETKESDNQVWNDLHIDAATNRVTQIDHGRSACGPHRSHGPHPE